MKPLHKILSEGLLDTDFDVGVEDVYADNIANKIIEIASVRELEDYDRTVNELHNLLKSAAREQQDQNISIMRKLRMKDNTSVYMHKEGPDRTFLSLRRFVKNPRPLALIIALHKQTDGSCQVLLYSIHPTNHPSTITREMKETIVFLAPEVWDDVEDAYKNRYK